ASRRRHCAYKRRNGGGAATAGSARSRGGYSAIGGGITEGRRGSFHSLFVCANARAVRADCSRQKRQVSLALRKSRFFEEDVLGQFVWYLYEASEEVAWRFQANVDQTLVE